jgi:hypothetical protein
MRAPWILPAIAAVTACGDLPSMDTGPFSATPLYSHWTCEELEWNSGNDELVECQDRDPYDWERDFLANWIGETCEAAASILMPFLMHEIRIRIDPNAAYGDWHWGQGFHFSEQLLNHHDYDYIRWVLAHEAGHQNCNCADQVEADRFASECLGPT